MNSISSTTLIAVLLVLISCKESSRSTAEGDSKVFHYSGAVQCQPTSGISLAEMQMQLTNAGIDVVCAQTGADGMNYPAVCGGQTGEINIYQIREENLEDAINLGFTPVIALPNYADLACVN